METNDYIEKKVEELKKKQPGVPAHNLSVLRDMLKREDREQEWLDKVVDQEFKWGEPKEY